MKQYFTNKNMMIGILLVLLGLSIIEIIMHSLILKGDAVYMMGFGMPFVTAILSVLLIFFALKGKDRLFYILCAGWLAYFVLSQVFSMPVMLVTALDSFSNGSDVIYSVATVFRLICMVCIVVIGGLLVEYLNDGTIYNKAFKVSCAITTLLLLIYAVLSIYDMIQSGNSHYIFATLYALTAMTLVFLFTYFAYDSAKTQLSKTQL